MIKVLKDIDMKNACGPCDYKISDLIRSGQMSQIRRVRIKIKDVQTIEQTCSGCGLGVVKEKNKIVITNHGINTYGNRPIELTLQPDGSYELSGDCSKSELDKLAGKIKAQYNLTVITKAGQKLGYNVVSKTKEKGKIKLKLRTFN
jgi:hypothetical protein